MSCTLAWCCVGLWPTNASKVNVNTAHYAKSICGGIIAAGNDDGIIKLFSYPVTDRMSSFMTLIGHSPHISNVRFTAAEQYLLSSGATDRSIMIWEIS